jgi:hypothetical protein
MTFKPSLVRVLFVGESRPDGGTFFYAANSKLFFATEEAFAAAYAECPEEKEFLEFFRDKGCFLEDLCRAPVNKLPRDEREREHEKGIGPLARRVAEHDPRAVVIVMLGIVSHVRRALQEAAQKTKRPPAPIYALPFPRSEHKARYVRELTVVLRKLQDSGVLEGA